jgi:nucleoside-diphosphate-sugar epimerase
MKQRLLITGGQGFVGKALADGALTQGLTVRVSSRRKFIATDRRLEHIQTGDLGPATDWLVALQGVDFVVHCAGRAHMMNDKVSDPLAIFRTVNRDGTLNLARQAVAAGVKRFVYVSSIGVNGVQSAHGKLFSEVDQPNPHNAYALSKWEAEQSLMRIADEDGLEVVVIRPPLVYGCDAPGNFGALMRAVQRGWPLPLGAIYNKRSLVALDNLVDLIITCLDHPAAANQIFLVSDAEDISTTELLRRMAHALGRPACLMPIPVSLLKVGAGLLGRRDMVQRLCGSLQVDISKARTLLGWSPPICMEEGLRRTAQGFLHEKIV